MNQVLLEQQLKAVNTVLENVNENLASSTDGLSIRIDVGPEGEDKKGHVLLYKGDQLIDMLSENYYSNAFSDDVIKIQAFTSFIASIAKTQV